MSLTTVFALAHLFIPSLSLSVFIVLLQVVLDHPTLRFPSYCHVNAVVQIMLFDHA
jgi:hypothetical protein